MTATGVPRQLSATAAHPPVCCSAQGESSEGARREGPRRKETDFDVQICDLSSHAQMAIYIDCIGMVRCYGQGPTGVFLVRFPCPDRVLAWLLHEPVNGHDC